MTTDPSTRFLFDGERVIGFIGGVNVFAFDEGDLTACAVRHAKGDEGVDRCIFGSR